LIFLDAAKPDVMMGITPILTLFSFTWSKIVENLFQIESLTY